MKVHIDVAGHTKSINLPRKPPVDPLLAFEPMRGYRANLNFVAILLQRVDRADAVARIAHGAIDHEIDMPFDAFIAQASCELESICVSCLWPTKRIGFLEAPHARKTLPLLIRVNHKDVAAELFSRHAHQCALPCTRLPCEDNGFRRFVRS